MNFIVLYNVWVLCGVIDVEGMNKIKSVSFGESNYSLERRLEGEGERKGGGFGR